MRSLFGQELELIAIKYSKAQRSVQHVDVNTKIESINNNSTGRATSETGVNSEGWQPYWKPVDPTGEVRVRVRRRSRTSGYWTFRAWATALAFGFA